MTDFLDAPHAHLIVVSPNEFCVDQKSKFETGDGPERDVPSMEDPVGAPGVGAWARPNGRRNYYLGKVRFDVLRWKDGKKHRTEVGFMKIAVDELFDGDGVPLPMWGLFLGLNDEGSNDSDEQPVALFTRRGIRFFAPIYGVAALPHDPQGISAMWSPNKSYVTQQQDDGNFVTYEFERPGVAGSRFRPKWSAWSGQVVYRSTGEGWQG